MAGHSIIQLATTILEKTTTIDGFLKANGLPGPSLLPDAPPTLQLSPEVEACLQQALAAIDELNVLLLGPLGWLKQQVDHTYGLVSLHALYKYKIPSRLPIGEEASICDLAARCCCCCWDEGGNGNGDAAAAAAPLGRILQHAVTNHLLAQPRPGYIAHAACSALLARDPALMDWVGSACEDLWPAAPRVVPALSKWPTTTTTTTTTAAATTAATTTKPRRHATTTVAAFNLAEATETPFFDALALDPGRARRFASAMAAMTQGVPGFEPAAALDAYDWAALADADAAVVDVGGSEGAFAIALKRRHPALRVTVQDLPGVIEGARARFGGGSGGGGEDATTTTAAAAAAEIVWQGHDFFDVQPARNVDVFFLRLVLHDWPDALCSTILRQLIPALRPGARIIVNDLIVPPPGSLPIYLERRIRCQDLAMLALFNSKERSREEWAELITATDPRFRVKSIVQTPKSPLGLLEIVWTP